MTAISSSYNNQIFKPTEFKCLLKYHSGIPFRLSHVKCPECKTTNLDIYGDHAISCSSSKQRIAKHSKLIKFISSQISPFIPHRFEVKVGSDILGDIVLLDYKRNKDLYLDITVVNSLCPTYLNAAAVSSGGAMAKRKQEKLIKYREVVEREGLAFLPLVVEILGGWDKQALLLFKEISRKLSEYLFMEPQVAIRRLMTGLSCILQKANAEMLVSRMYSPL